MSITQMIGWGALAVLVFWVVGAYNRLVQLRQRIDSAFAQIDLQLRRRYELIPGLVESARKYVEHERETLEAVSAARNQAHTAAHHARARPTDPGAVGALLMAEQALDGVLDRFMALGENYPELKADETLHELGEELAGTENRIAFACQAFNEAVLDYNEAASQFPTRLISAAFGFRSAGLLQPASGQAERPPLRVQF